MKTADWLVKEDGICRLCKSVREWDLLAEEYRLYRFLTEVEDIMRLAAAEGINEESSLSGLRMLAQSKRSPAPYRQVGVWMNFTARHERC